MLKSAEEWVWQESELKLSMSQEELSEIQQAIRSAADVRDKERLQAILLATSGQHSLAALLSQRHRHCARATLSSR